MSERPTLFIAGVGMITPVGFNTTMTAAAVRANVSAYEETEYPGQHGLPVTMAAVPESVFDELDAEIEDGDCYDSCHDRVLKMAIIAIREACSNQTATHPVPLLLAMPEHLAEPAAVGGDGLVPLVPTLAHNCKPWISPPLCRTIHGGRAAGMEAIDFAFRHLYDQPYNFVLVGGSDSYRDTTRLDPLSKADRLKVPGCQDGFVPGEAGGFLLLTRRPEFALRRNGYIIAIHPPGIADEPGHLYSEEPYRGDGLDRAFKNALGENPPANALHSIYTSMNGEYHWAKEYGVAYLRNRDAFCDPVGVEHPADCFGDIGCATAPVLVGLAAEHLWRDAAARSQLVYSSSDRGKRGAVVLEKISLQSGATSVSASQQRIA